MLYFIGLGLFSEDDISVKACKALNNVDVIYAEFYTAKLMGGNIDNLFHLSSLSVRMLRIEILSFRRLWIRMLHLL